MLQSCFIGINLALTGSNIHHLREASGYSVSQLQSLLGLEAPQAIYKWQWGQCLPSLDNLVILSDVFGVPMDDIIVRSANSDAPHGVKNSIHIKQRDDPAAFGYLLAYLNCRFNDSAVYSVI